MYRKMILVLFVICLIFCGCQDQNIPSEPTDTASETTAATPTHPLEKISLGMTPEQLLQLLSEVNISIEMPNYAEFPLPEEVPDAIPDGRIYNMTDLSFYYKAAQYDLYFTFRYEGSLVRISCFDENLPTLEGLAVGDSLQTAINLYGNDYEKDPEDFSVLQYETPDGYFNIYYDGETVTQWQQSVYCNINND